MNIGAAPYNTLASERRGGADRSPPGVGRGVQVPTGGEGKGKRITDINVCDLTSRNEDDHVWSVQKKRISRQGSKDKMGIRLRKGAVRGGRQSGQKLSILSTK